MWELAGDLAATLERALWALAEALGGAAPAWLALGVVLHLANQVARGRGWYAIVRTATAEDPDVRRRDAIAAWVAGAGAGGLVSARGGDAVRVLLLGRRVPRAGCPVLAGTLVAEGAGELAAGALLLAAALALGVAPALGAPPPGAAPIVAAAALALAGLVLVARRVPALRRFFAGVGCGCAALRRPRAYARGVLPWQLASRALRAGALLCFLAAFGLPATPAAVLLVMFAQGSGRLLPFAPASLGATVAMLAAAFGPVTGTAVEPAQVAAFFVGTSTVLTVVGTALAAVICARTVPWQALAVTLRVARRQPAQARA